MPRKAPIEEAQAARILIELSFLDAGERLAKDPIALGKELGLEIMRRDEEYIRDTVRSGLIRLNIPDGSADETP